MIEKVIFKNGKLRLSGNLHFPENFEKTSKYISIIMMHPGGGVKEQTVGLYAKKLAKQGFVALAYDASFQGESEGESRFLEDPFMRVEDVRSAIDYLSTLSFVDMDKIGVVGICAGAGYAINAAQTERRIKAVAGISTLDIGSTYRWGMGTETLNEVAKQRTAEANGTEKKYVPYVLEAVDENTDPSLVEAHEYYYKIAPHLNSPNKMLFTSYDKIFAFTAFDQVENLLIQPIVLIAGKKAGSLMVSEQLIDRISSKKELYLVDDATHINFYGTEKYVKIATDKLKTFFTENL